MVDLVEHAPITGEVRMVWAGDERVFRLAIANCLALEERRGCGLSSILTRLESGGWWVDDVRETLRIALTGGGMDAKAARKLVDDHCSDGRLQESVLTAYIVVSAAISAPTHEPEVGKDQAAGDPVEATDASPLPPLSEPVQQ